MLVVLKQLLLLVHIRHYLIYVELLLFPEAIVLVIWVAASPRPTIHQLVHIFKYLVLSNSLFALLKELLLAVFGFGVQSLVV